MTNYVKKKFNKNLPMNLNRIDCDTKKNILFLVNIQKQNVK